jgi:phosphonate transport system substrate-binding protein
MSTIIRFAAICAVFLLAAGLHAQEQELQKLRFGIISTESSENLKASWGGFISAMSKKTGYEIEPFFAPDYAGVIEAMRYDKVEFAWFGNKSAMEAVDRSGGEIFTQTVDVEGNPGYWSLIVVHKDSPYQTIDDIIAQGSNLSFGNGDPNSTSGFLIPSFYIWARRGIDPVDAFANVTNANHESNLLSVANKKVDFATNNTESLRRMQQKNPGVADQIRVVWKSPLIPNDPFVWRKNLPDANKQTLKAFFLSYGRLGSDEEIAQARAVLAKTSSGLAPFVDSSNHQLLPIRQLALVKNKLKLQKSSDYSEAEKTERIAAIDEELTQLDIMKELLAQGK